MKTPSLDRSAVGRVAVQSALAAVLLGVLPSLAAAREAPFEYRLSFPSPEHRWMMVEARFAELPAGTAEIRMSRTSPGRYALHEFAKNVFEVRITNGAGAELQPERPNLHQWNVRGHDGTVVVSYKVFGDRSDGTYLSVDAAHAHMNMPATVMYVRGQLTRPARITLVQPAGRQWRVATQLFPTADPLVFTAPNVQYLMDSPVEFGSFTWRTFTVTDGASTVPGQLRLTVLRAGRVDLSVAVSAAPSPVALDTPAAFTFTITNNARDVEVGAVSLQVVITGEVPFRFGSPTTPGCTAATTENQTTLACTLGDLDHLAATQVLFRAGVQLEQIDVVGAQAAEAAGDALLQRGHAPVVATGALEVTALGEEVAVLASIGDCLTDQRLGVAVALRGVDDVEARVERLVQQTTNSARLGALEADLRAAESEHADV